MNVRKRTYAVVCMLTALLFMPACTNSPEENLIGEWQAEEPETGTTISLLFDEDGTMTATRETNDERISARGTWALYSDPTPMHLDFTLRGTSGETVTRKTIIRFVSKDEIEMRRSAGSGSRPEGFPDDDDGNTGDIFTLRRQ